MKKSELIEILGQLKTSTNEAYGQLQEDTESRLTYERLAQALDETERILNTPTDRHLANGALLATGFVLGAVAILSAVSGMLLVWMGNLEPAGQLVPYIVIPALVSILAFMGMQK